MSAAAHRSPETSHINILHISEKEMATWNGSQRKMKLGLCWGFETSIAMGEFEVSNFSRLSHDVGGLCEKLESLHEKVLMDWGSSRALTGLTALMIDEAGIFHLLKGFLSLGTLREGSPGKLGLEGLSS
ncbi:hypothetical protein DM860_007233 [Cuscuta australis]|uniref:Uncharacterized protein n=1 Tax=Cuscuta australis TaxID=267555 RepID=A0A328E4K2_9ASTE|nr:hypothetical protein DM860_007233 [Cuscuta australis]